MSRTHESMTSILSWRRRALSALFSALLWLRLRLRGGSRAGGGARDPALDPAALCDPAADLAEESGTTTEMTLFVSPSSLSDPGDESSACGSSSSSPSTPCPSSVRETTESAGVADRTETASSASASAGRSASASAGRTLSDAGVLFPEIGEARHEMSPGLSPSEVSRRAEKRTYASYV